MYEKFCLGAANYETKIGMLCAHLKIVNGGCLKVIYIYPNTTSSVHHTIATGICVAVHATASTS